jgi:hypothetical protein
MLLTNVGATIITLKIPHVTDSTTTARLFPKTE